MQLVNSLFRLTRRRLQLGSRKLDQWNIQSENVYFSNSDTCFAIWANYVIDF